MRSRTDATLHILFYSNRAFVYSNFEATLGGSFSRKKNRESKIGRTKDLECLLCVLSPYTKSSLSQTRDPLTTVESFRVVPHVPPSGTLYLFFYDLDEKYIVAM